MSENRVRELKEERIDADRGLGFVRVGMWWLF